MHKGLRIAGFAGALAGIAAFGVVGPDLMRRAADAAEWLESAEDPARLASLGLRTSLTGERLAAELQAALDADDVDLAESFLALAEQQGMSVPVALRARYEAATATVASVRRGAGAFYTGLVSGDGATGAGLAGVVAADLTGVGDVRDLVREGRKVANGEEPDRLTLGLAAAGLVLTGATVATVGVALPARAGVSTLRVAARSGRLSKPLAADLTRLAGDAFDPKALAAAAGLAGKLEVTAAKTALAGAVRPASLAALRGMAEDVALIGRRAGVRGAQEALALADDAAGLRRVAKLSEARGTGTRAVLKVLGRSAITLGSGAAILAGWVMAGVGYAWAALLIMLAVVRRLARVTWWSGRMSLRGLRSVAGLTGRLRSHAPQ